MNNLNIVELIEQNPIAKLSDAYNNKLLIKIKETFTGFEQKLFVSSFYCYLNYDNDDFVIDLDNIWKWIGFTFKATAKDLLEKQFKLDIDYKILIRSRPEQDLSNNNERKWGGHNRNTIVLTINCFKSLCLKARTKKADEIHDYYMKLEKILHQVIEEETDELRQQLEQKENIITQIKESSETEKQKLRKEKQRGIEQAIITQFPVNTECIYFGTINNTNEAKENLIKFGHTNDLATRVLDHRKKYDNFILVQAFRVQNKVEIENLIKNYPKIKRQIRSIEINGKQKTEIIAYDTANFTIEKLTKHIKDIIHSKTYSIDNFNRIMKQNDELEKENRELKEELEQYKTKSSKLAVEMVELRELIEKQKISISIAQTENQSVFEQQPTEIQQPIYQNTLLPEDETTKKFKEFIDTMCIVRADVDESSTNLEGQFRIWCRTKPKKETFHALKHYLDTRFRPARISTQNKNQVVNGYIGVKLKEITYKKKLENSAVETFLFQVCRFSPNGKILNSTLLTEYQRWKQSVNIEQSANDMKELKDYLNSCEYVIKSTVWTDVGSNEGYYGIGLKSDEHKHKTTSSTGKTVEKREINTNVLLGKWETIAKAAEAEKISAAKMSRSIKNKVVFNDYYYCIST
uniref:MSV199 domain-containing protein n=1 Tax=viral metagenome TaxID=1070528 RepID=A0A6C0D1J1_9ZZZZ